MTWELLKTAIIKTELEIDWVGNYKKSLFYLKDEWKDSNSGPVPWTEEYRDFMKDKNKKNDHAEKTRLIAEMRARQAAAKATGKPTYKYAKQPDINKPKRIAKKQANAKTVPSKPRAASPSPRAAPPPGMYSPRASPGPASPQDAHSPRDDDDQADVDAEQAPRYLHPSDKHVQDSVSNLINGGRTVYVRVHADTFQYLSISNQFGDEDYHDLAKENKYVELEDYIQDLSNNVYGNLSEMIMGDARVEQALIRSAQLIQVDTQAIDTDVPADLQKFIKYGEHVRQFINELISKARFLQEGQVKINALEDIAQGINPANTQEFHEYTERRRQAKETQDKIEKSQAKIRDADTADDLEETLAEAETAFRGDRDSINTIMTTFEAKMRQWFNTGGYTPSGKMLIQEMQNFIKAAYESRFVSSKFEEDHNADTYISHVTDTEAIKKIESEAKKSIPEIFKENPRYNMKEMDFVWKRLYNMYEKLSHLPLQDQAEQVKLTNIERIVDMAFKNAGDVKRFLISNQKMMSLYLTGEKMKSPVAEQARLKVMEQLTPLVDK